MTDKFAVIFDMDGTLIDSTKYIWASFNHILNQHGVHIHNHEINPYLGLSIKDHVKVWKEKYGVDLDLNEFIKKANSIQFDLMSNDLKPNNGLVELLEELKQNNIKMGIGTSSTIDRAEKMLKMAKIEKYFSTISATDHVVLDKPHPDIFLSVAKKLKVEPKDCVVIEDANSGIEAAKRGGMKAVGYLAPFTTRDKLRDADLIVESFSELSYQKIKDLFI